MSYKVYLVEDEITTREGIRDNVNWQAAGFELCGEASDGEIALPQIETILPDLLITDIKMPFMDGLQLCNIIREHMPWMKIIIISGFNDFQYAQTAIKLGVSEYLLKPVSVEDIQTVLAKVAITLDQERNERAYLKNLRSQVEDNLYLLRQKFLLRLATGGESSISAIEQSRQLGLKILSPWYQVILLKLKSQTSAVPLDYQTCQLAEKLITGMVSIHNDVLMAQKDLEEFVLIMKGENQEYLEQEGSFLAGLIRTELENKIACKMIVSVGTPQQRLGDLHRSFAAALMSAKEIESGDLKKLDHSGLLHFLETGDIASFDEFFEHDILPFVEAGLRSSLLKRYVMVDIALSVSQFISDLGGNSQQIIPTDYAEDNFLANLHSQEQVRMEIKQLFGSALAFRDSQAGNDHAVILQQAKAYIAQHFSDSNLALNDVASHVNFSPNHFSAVFSAETGVTFRDYLTRMRIEQAKKLLRTTKIKCAEVAFQCGYNDPHYFSMIFRKNCGLTPQQFRLAKRM